MRLRKFTGSRISVSLALLMVLAGLQAGGCNMILQPIEQGFLFRPWEADPERLAQIAEQDKNIDEVRLTAADGVKLHGWLKRPKSVDSSGKYPLVIVFGGVRRETSWIIDRANESNRWGWLFINYRGFGLSEGRPSESIILEDSRLIYDYAVARPDVDRSKIVVLGRSLGTYFSVALAHERPLLGAILATPFDSFTAIGRDRYRWLPVGLLLNGRYDAAAMAPDIKIPALFIFAERDNVTPVKNGTTLARAWGGAKRMITLEGAPHYGIERRGEFWSSIGTFLREIDEQTPPVKNYALDSMASPRR